MFAHFFCRHKYASIRKTESKVTRAAMPQIPIVPGHFFIAKNIQVKFYEVTTTTEVFMCEKCGHTKTLNY